MIAREKALSALSEFPDGLCAEYERARPVMDAELSPEQVGRWFETGIEIAGQSAHSWDAAVQFFRASPGVIASMPPNHFMKWVECGLSLSVDSPTLGSSYFVAGPRTMAILGSRHIEAWTDLGRGLYKGTWKSSTLANRFFETSPDLLDELTFEQFQRFVGFLDILSRHSYDLAAECLALGQRLFPIVGEDKDAFISLSLTLVETGWRQVKAFFEASAKALPRVEQSQRLRFLRMSETLLVSGATNMPSTMLEISQAMQDIEPGSHGQVLDMAQPVMEILPTAMPEFVKNAPVVLDRHRLSLYQLSVWCEEGKRVLHQNRDGGLAFFKIESAHSERFLEEISSGIEFSRIQTIVEMYCRALAGEEVDLADTQDLVDKNIGWVSSESPTTEGSTVYLPSLVDRYPTKDENFLWFKVVATHQVARMEFGSFRFEFDRPAARFENMRFELEKARPSGGGPLPSAADLQRFFDLFDDRQLALDVFSVVEDGRVDAKVKVEYRGIRRPYERVQRDSLESRTEIRDLPAREALVEFLVRVSLSGEGTIYVPSEHKSTARQIAAIARQTMTDQATVEDTAEATLRIYALLVQVANEEVDRDDWDPLDVEEEPESESLSDPDAMNSLMEQMGAGSDPNAEQSEEQYDSPKPVDYRGDFKPELTQFLERLRNQGQGEEGDEQGEAITQEMLERLLESSVEVAQESPDGEARSLTDEMTENMLKEVGLQKPDSAEGGQGPLVHVDESGGELEADEPETFVYDEWDFRAEDYKPRWCVVRQKNMPEGDATYYSSVLGHYGSLVQQVRRQFELMVPEMMRKERRLQDGEDIDIDDVIEAMVDIHTGSSPSEKLYWRRNKVQRDVAVVFLLDTSASTAEAIDDSKRTAEDWGAPDDPVEYMLWLRSRRGEGAKRSYKRIIDLEKEALVLLINALEAIGDTYGIYGFSGYGRENVEFYTIKDVDELFSERIRRRIDRIAPLHATRMGPAIRHATAKLDEQDARTKLLFLISDGRPQDRGYSREGVEKEYAVHDTRMALDEARAKAVNAFCLTVDRNGHDYLKTMTQDMGYEVLDDIYSLPHRLLYLYRKLTM